MSTSAPADQRLFVTEWDECAIATERAAIIREDDPALSDAEAFELALLDEDVLGMEWEWMLEDLGEALREISPGGHYHAEGRNLGWRQCAGFKDFSAQSPADFLAQILPKTDCTFTIERDGRTLYITNYHHDAPTGEFYVITPLDEAPE